MAQLARSSAPVVSSAIDHYVAAIADRFAATLRVQLATLREPAVYVDPARALQLCGYAVETLAGFARGAALAPIHALAKKYAIAPAIGELATTTTIAFANIRMLPDASSRPLVDALGAQLHQRLAHDIAALKAHARRMLLAVSDHAAIAAALEVAADDTASALRFGDQIGYGWSALVAALAGAAAPSIAHVRSRELWHGWLRTVRGERLAPRAEPAIGEAVVTEFIMRIG